MRRPASFFARIGWGGVEDRGPKERYHGWSRLRAHVVRVSPGETRQEALVCRSSVCRSSEGAPFCRRDMLWLPVQPSRASTGSPCGAWCRYGPNRRETGFRRMFAFPDGDS